MDFSVFSTDADSSNWQQEHQPITTTDGFTGNNINNNKGGGSGHGGLIRPGSMADRARLVNIQLPKTALKCQRCDSTNTKFSYFNNYSLTQPRYYCKTCHRYWTRGGTLKRVPVGGGCRRKKRTRDSSDNSEMGTSSPSSSSMSSVVACFSYPLR